jgi:hypothetical protein
MTGVEGERLAVQPPRRHLVPAGEHLDPGLVEAHPVRELVEHRQPGPGQRCQLGAVRLVLADHQRLRGQADRVLPGGVAQGVHEGGLAVGPGAEQEDEHVLTHPAVEAEPEQPLQEAGGGLVEDLVQELLPQLRAFGAGLGAGGLADHVGGLRRPDGPVAQVGHGVP